jgi:hypothetical protein
MAEERPIVEKRRGGFVRGFVRGGEDLLYPHEKSSEVRVCVALRFKMPSCVC